MKKSSWSDYAREYVLANSRGEDWCVEFVEFVSNISGIPPNIIHRNIYKLAHKNKK